MKSLTALARGLAFACALALACVALPLGAAAEPDAALDIDFSINPGEMVAPGDATMTFIITNRSDYDIQNVYISSADGLLSEPIGQIGSGETQTLVRPHAVTQAELDEGAVRYIISHDAAIHGGEKVTHQLSAAVVKGSARPDVDFTRQLSSRYIAEGGLLTITYKLTNNGNVPASDIYVRDTLGDFTGRLETLEVGATKTFISRVTISAETESAASMEYTTPSGETFTRKLDPVPIRLSDSALEAAFSIGRSVFDADRADAILILTNTGNDDYTGITVIDDVYGGVIADAVTLPRGSDPLEIAYTYPVRGDGEYRWRVTGASQAGETLDFVTNTLTLRDNPNPSQVTVSLSAKARATKINRAGRVTFDLELANAGTVTAEDLQIYEIERGPVRRLAVLPTGEPARFQVAYDVRESGQFIFCVNYSDADGRARTASATPIDVQITPAGVPPESADGEGMALRGGSVKMSATSTFTILLAVASAALVSMITILLVTSLRARADRRRRAAAQRQRQRGAAGRTGARPAAQARGKRRGKPRQGQKKKRPQS